MMKSVLISTFFIQLFIFSAENVLHAQCNSNPCSVPTPSENAQDACVLPNPAALDCYFGATTNTIPVSFPPSWCTTIENNHFFAFTADAQVAQFEICCHGCQTGNGVQAAVLATNDCINFQFVSPCLGNIVSQSCETLVATGLNPGEVYFLMIDGNAGALCDYSINGVNPTINGPTSGICLPNNSMQTYYASTVSTWTINPPTAGAIQGNPTSASVNVVWAESGPAQVCATSLSCPNAPNYCLDVVVGQDVQSTETVMLCQNQSVECAGNTYTTAGSYLVTLPSYWGCDSVINCIVQVIPTIQTTQNVVMCQGESVQCAGEEFFVPGNYTVTLPSYLGCDSIVHCLVSVSPITTVDLGKKYVCPGSCFQLGDSSYCAPGQYVHFFKNQLGCDSLVSFELVIVQINNAAAIQTPQGLTITCAQPSLTLQSLNTPGVSHLWKNFAGDTLGTGNSIVVNTAGIYFHLVEAITSGPGCSSQAKILIKKNSSPPPVTAMGGIIDASHPTVQLMGHSIISGVIYQWTGPNGFTSNLKKPIVSVPGFYTLTVTNPQTGCTNSITVEVIQM